MEICLHSLSIALFDSLGQGAQIRMFGHRLIFRFTVCAAHHVIHVIYFRIYPRMLRILFEPCRRILLIVFSGILKKFYLEKTVFQRWRLSYTNSCLSGLC